MSVLPLKETFVSALSMSACRKHCRNKRLRGVTTVALGIKSVSATQGNSIVPLYVPPERVSVTFS
jgi:hypothetical protein